LNFLRYRNPLCLGLLGLKIFVSSERGTSSDEHNDVNDNAAQAGCWWVGGGGRGSGGGLLWSWVASLIQSQ